MTTTHEIARVDAGHVKPVVIMEDEPTHTEENGYCCGQAGCPCMADESEEATE